jgi:hypothetical protein
MAVITLEGDVRIMTFHPPVDFDPLTASSAELERYGFPARPDDPRLLERFQRVFERLKGRFHYVEPTFQINRGRSHGPRKRTFNAGVWTGDNWSGGVVNVPTGQSFNGILGDWVVPNVYPATPTAEWCFCANWIGLDGDGSGDVCQAGVECQVFGTRSSRIAGSAYHWHQWFPGPAVTVTNVPVGFGDFVTVVLCTPSGAGSKTATVHFADITSGIGTSYVISAPNVTTLAGNSAEWIVEAPTIGGVQSPLADYGEVFFSSCVAGLSGGGGVGGGAGTNVKLRQAGTVISQGTLITENIIRCQYITV